MRSRTVPIRQERHRRQPVKSSERRGKTPHKREGRGRIGRRASKMGFRARQIEEVVEKEKPGDRVKEKITRVRGRRKIQEHRIARQSLGRECVRQEDHKERYSR